jgi:hypothetical protein
MCARARGTAAPGAAARRGAGALLAMGARCCGWWRSLLACVRPAAAGPAWSTPVALAGGGLHDGGTLRSAGVCAPAAAR